MNLAWLDTPTIAVAVIYAMTCLPLAWAHVTLAASARKRALIWVASLVIGVVLVALGRGLYYVVLELMRADPQGGRSWLLKIGLAGFIGIGLCAPTGLAALRLLKRRRSAE
ncbi:MAG: hypothetical protein JSW09_03985 [Pseudomonadota bacterium]|nr:MAG: hypothetical protein JSW09_03985 [Pseudomonadota bacterium]